jgi:hypothetical protein
MAVYWNVAGLFVCIITTVAMHSGQPYESASLVFGEVTNESGWSSNGTAFVIGWMLSTVNVGIIGTCRLLQDANRYI